MQDWMDMLHMAIGRDDAGISFAQMLVRALVVFVIGVALLRLTTPRLFGRATPVDIVLAVIIGSNLSRTLTGNAPFLEVIGATVFLVFVHAVLTRAAARWRPLANLVKGRTSVLVREGEICWREMHANAVGERDLMAAIRAAGGASVDKVKTATLERNGDLDVVMSGD
jgi:uncharacterized membrane protein YcaP (DUF421 family)